MPFRRLLVANRGEIAIRIFRAATELNIRTIAIYAHEDRFALHRYKADEAYKIGDLGDPVGAYLNWQRIVATAVDLKVDAIHPGYGFLSENADFAAACAAEGIKFIGPSAAILRTFGDKIAAKKAAVAAGIPVIPGPLEPVATADAAKTIAKQIGYPVMLKALAGGGGKGIRIVNNDQELVEAFARAKSEAKNSFGRDDIYLEKTIHAAKHIEVQILGDTSGQVVHLFERDCSIQRRHQKIVEVAPSLSISSTTRDLLLDSSVKLGKAVGYVGVGTVEYLVTDDGQAYFLEVNPRIQVEHTVTEIVTGVDLVQASIMTADGKPLSHPTIGISDQSSVTCRGVAIQCRVTTEDPKNNFVPDTGRITAFRPPQGFGIRIDEGHVTAGGVVTPHYDSLLVKVCAYGPDLYGAARKMHRALTEFRIRGVRHNIPVLKNIVAHPNFVAGKADINFLQQHPEVFSSPVSRDRASKILRFIADVSVNNPHSLPSKIYAGERDASPPVLRQNLLPKNPPLTAKQVFAKSGASGLVDWIKQQDHLLLTDTTMRDAHQSLFATRLRTRDILRCADYYRDMASDLFSIEMWGGATFDTCLRFLKEDPWERLQQVREKIPNALLQMLLRGDNAVGYANYPEWVIRDFIREAVNCGLDIFRIFDCLNNPEQMAIAMDEVKKQGAIVEACVCYTGNVISPKENKYTISYYTSIAKRLVAMGTDILCIKDMAGLLRPEAARVLITALRETVDVPIHLHTHDTSGNGVAMLTAAAQAGCHIVDGAVSSMSGLTSQPSLNALVAALEGTKHAPSVSLEVLDELGRYWEVVRSMYQAFDPGIKATSTRVYEHEIPGGQYSNLYDQARSVGVSAQEFFELTERYKEVNDLLGNIVKVTPSSKVVGDFALLLQKHHLTGPQFRDSKPQLDYPDSVVSFFKGHMGTPYGGFPDDVRALVLGQNPAPPQKPPLENTGSRSEAVARLQDRLGREATDQELLSYVLYPKVFHDFVAHQLQYAKVDTLPTPVFFYGIKPNDEIEIDIDPGKTLVVSLQGISEPDQKGYRTVFFSLNGYPREVRILDSNVQTAGVQLRKADLTSPLQIGAPMPGKVISVPVQKGEKCDKGAVLLVTESMKMEYVIHAKQSGIIKDICVKVGDQVESGDLLLEMSEAKT